MREFIFAFSAVADFPERELTIDLIPAGSLGEAREALAEYVNEVTFGNEQPDSPIWDRIRKLNIGEIEILAEGDSVWFVGIARSRSEAKSLAAEFVLGESDWEILVR